MASQARSEVKGWFLVESNFDTILHTILVGVEVGGIVKWIPSKGLFEVVGAG